MRSGLSGWAKRIVKNPSGLYLILVILIALLAVHSLGSRPAGLDSAGLTAKNASQSLNVIKNHPVNAPHNLLAFGVHKTGLSWLSSLRLSSVMFALIFTWSITFILWSWFGGTIGIMGALLFIATPLFLIASRQGSAEIMYFSLAAIMAVYVWTLRAHNKDFGLILLFIVCALAIYTPGVALWLAGAAAVSRKKMTDTLSLVSPPAITVGLLLGVLLLVPLALSLVNDWHLVKALVPLPAHFAQPLTMLKETVWMAIAVFVKAPYHTDLWIARLPVLNIIQDALLIFGVYALWRAAPKKLLALAAGVLFAITAAGVNNDIALLALALTPLAVVICAGIRYLYIEWLSVFPLNPVARSLALALLWAAVIIQLFFGIRYADVAWPVTSSTKAAYVLK
jgi:hypothetical protein